jgi:uncharacterized protein YndB with AHSA1/START domain
MITRTVANSDSFQVTTPTDHEIQMTRLFNASRERVFEALTQPEHVRKWWGALGEGYSVPVCEIDLRVGGGWRFVNRHPNGEVTFYGTYREISPPTRLVYTEIFADYPDTESLVTNVLGIDAGKTRLTVTSWYPSLEVRDLVLGSGMEYGAAKGYDRIEEIAAQLESGG